MKNKVLPEILTLKQASEVLNCHPNTLRNWSNEGRVKAIRLGNRGDRRFRKQEIMEMLNDNGKQRSVGKN